MEPNWEKLIVTEGPGVWRTCCRLLGNAADAADAYQETFLNALQYARGQDVQHWTALLRTLATRRALDVLRRRLHPADPLLSDTRCGMAVGPDPTPEDCALCDDLGRRLREALIELPERYAEVFCLRVFEELTEMQTAALLNIREGSVRVILHRARARLREHLNGRAGPSCG